MFSAFNAHALGALAEVAGPGLNAHLSMVLPALLSAMVGDDKVCYKNFTFMFSEAPLICPYYIPWHLVVVFMRYMFLVEIVGCSNFG